MQVCKIKKGAKTRQKKLLGYDKQKTQVEDKYLITIIQTSKQGDFKKKKDGCDNRTDHSSEA